MKGEGKEKGKGKLIDYILFYSALVLSLMSIVVKDYITFSIGLFIIALACISIVVEKNCKECIDKLEKK